MEVGTARTFLRCCRRRLFPHCRHFHPGPGHPVATRDAIVPPFDLGRSLTVLVHPFCMSTVQCNTSSHHAHHAHHTTHSPRPISTKQSCPNGSVHIRVPRAQREDNQLVYHRLCPETTPTPPPTSDNVTGRHQSVAPPPASLHHRLRSDRPLPSWPSISASMSHLAAAVASRPARATPRSPLATNRSVLSRSERIARRVSL